MSPSTTLEGAVQAALETVIDPELDRSLVELGFATATVQEGGDVTIEVRLPTFWCAPNFAYLMVQDAEKAVAAVPGVRALTVRLLDHYVAEEVTRGVGKGRSFDSSFPEQSNGQGLEDLRRLFQVKAFTVAQERLLRHLMASGCSKAAITELCVGDVDSSEPLATTYLEKRRRMGLSVAPEQPLAILPNGEKLSQERLDDYLGRARSTRMNMEANTVLCQSLHATRYGR